VRLENDLYETPPWCVHRLLEAWDVAPGKWLEPACGNLAIVLAVNKYMAQRFGRCPTWTLCDLNPGGEVIDGHPVHAMDYIRYAGRPEVRGQQFDVVITNPPYSDADRFVRLAVQQAHSVAMLLRLNWLAGDDRASWLSDHTPDVYVLPNRPDFTGAGGDATDYAWLVWHQFDCGAPRVQILGTTPAFERRKR